MGGEVWSMKSSGEECYSSTFCVSARLGKILTDHHVAPLQINLSKIKTLLHFYS